MTRERIIKEFSLFALNNGGIGGWLTDSTDAAVYERLSRIEEEPLRKVQLNQLLALANEGTASNGFYNYYWLQEPQKHTYQVSDLPGFRQEWIDAEGITSLEHLKWGLYRLYVDALLYFGNVRTAFRILRDLDSGDLGQFFAKRRFDTESIRDRGPALPLKDIKQDDRYLVSEMACKSYGESPDTPGEIKSILKEAYQSVKSTGRKTIQIRELLSDRFLNPQHQSRQTELEFSLDDVLELSIESDEELDEKLGQVAERFFKARKAALINTKYYLSMVGDLDVYVATSMRSRDDFRNMAKFCRTVFSDERLKGLNLRYFDPTLSAAQGHEDKGLIECLMVKCAKALVYCAGEKESFGKDAEAAMALSLGKPVVFFCDQEQKSRFYKDIHPLSRLIEFSTGVAVGALVTCSPGEVSELLMRIFENKMQYRLEQKKPGYLRLKEELTDSVVRLQTSDRLLSEAFWNQYHKLAKPEYVKY